MELTDYVAQLSPFQQTLAELWKVTPDPASESNKPLFEPGTEVFLLDVYQIWDEVIWLTPKKGHLMSSAPICRDQIEPSPEVSQQLRYNDWKQLGFLLQETM